MCLQLSDQTIKELLACLTHGTTPAQIIDYVTKESYLTYEDVFEGRGEPSPFTNLEASALSSDE